MSECPASLGPMSVLSINTSDSITAARLLAVSVCELRSVLVDLMITGSDLRVWSVDHTPASDAGNSLCKSRTLVTSTVFALWHMSNRRNDECKAIRTSH